MEWTILTANIVGLAISVVGILLYCYGLYKSELPFLGWRTTVGFIVAAIGGVFTLIISGALS